MRFYLRALKSKYLTELILKSRQARIGRPPKKLQKKPSEDPKPQPQLIAGPEFVPDRSTIDAEEESIRTEPFPTLSIIEEEYEPSNHSQMQISQEAPIDGSTEECTNTQHTNDDSGSDISSIGEQGLTAYLRRHHKKLDKSLRAQFKGFVYVAAQGDTLERGMKPGNNTPAEPISGISHNASSVYSDNKSGEFMGVDMEAILDYTAADHQLSADQVADLNGDIVLMRAGIYSEDAIQRTLLLQPRPETNSSLRNSTQLDNKFETGLSNDGRQSPVASITRFRSFDSKAESVEADHTQSGQPSASSTSSTEVSSTERGSISSYFTARTSASAPFLEFNDVQSSNRSSSESSNPSSTSDPVGSSSTETLSSPTSLLTGQTTPNLDPAAAVHGKRPFKIEHMIMIDEYCKKREHALMMGVGWLDLLWGFEGLQLQFKREFKWEPDLERFKDFEEKRKEDPEFWNLWDFPTILV